MFESPRPYAGQLLDNQDQAIDQDKELEAIDGLLALAEAEDKETTKTGIVAEYEEDEADEEEADEEEADEEGAAIEERKSKRRRSEGGGLMYAVTSPEPGVLEVNYMWLPTWIGMNTGLLQELGEVAAKATVGLPLERALEAGHIAIVDHLEEKYPNIDGLHDWLQALKLVFTDEKVSNQR